MSTNLINKVSIWAKNAQFWLLPSVCILCHQPGANHVDLCATCHATFGAPENPCSGCALTLPPGEFNGTLCGKCQDHERPIHQTLAAFTYQPPVAGLIGQFKYRGKLQHGRVLTDLLLAEIRRNYPPSQLPQLLLPIPLHYSRLRERGYNQALLMARQLGKALQIPMAHNVLERTLNTAAQQGLSATERKRNLRRAFVVKTPNQLEGMTSIALIDDVVTTMSTVTELARLIKRKVPTDLAIHVWCIARA